MEDETPPLAYDSDEEPPPEQPNENYLWRLDPIDSHSDFVIEIASSTEQGAIKVGRYHVHKNILSLGPRRSEYFATLLQGFYSEKSQGVCRIPLDAVAAKAFPALLDFLYGAPEVDCSTKNVTALHFMGQYFEMRRLRWQARQFWMRDLCLENCATYYKHAVLFHDERVLRRLQVTLGSEKLLKIAPDSELIKSMDPEFLLTVLQTADLVVADKITLGVHASKLVARVLDGCVLADDDEGTKDTEQEKQAFYIDAELFSQLTDSSYLTEIDLSVALKLLHHERRIVNPPHDTLTSLQHRCLQSMAQDWKVIKLDPSTLEMLRHVASATFLTELLAHAFTCAKELVSMQKAKIVSSTAQNSNLTHSLRAAEAESDRRNEILRRKDETIRMQNTRYEVLQRRTLVLEEELKQFQLSTDLEVCETSSENVLQPTIVRKFTGRR